MGGMGARSRRSKSQTIPATVVVGVGVQLRRFVLAGIVSTCMFIYIYVDVRFRFCPWWFQPLCSLVCPPRLFPLPILLVLSHYQIFAMRESRLRATRETTITWLCGRSRARTGSKHLHSLVDGGALLATERRRNAPKRGGATGPKDDSVL